MKATFEQIGYTKWRDRVSEKLLPDQAELYVIKRAGQDSSRLFDAGFQDQERKNIVAEIGKFIQDGVIGLRGPDGKIVESVPVYIEADEKSDMTYAKSCVDFSKAVLPKIKEYISKTRDL
mgnify:CR=1 FL=1